MSIDRYEGWTHGAFPDGLQRQRCVCCVRQIEYGYHKLIGDRVVVCCEACAQRLLAEIPLDDLLLLDGLVMIADELNVYAAEDTNCGYWVPGKSIHALRKWLDEWSKDAKHKPAK